MTPLKLSRPTSTPTTTSTEMMTTSTTTALTNILLTNTVPPIITLNPRRKSTTPRILSAAPTNTEWRIDLFIILILSVLSMYYVWIAHIFKKPSTKGIFRFFSFKEFNKKVDYFLIQKKKWKRIREGLGLSFFFPCEEICYGMIHEEGLKA